jgi:hypothetical protein
VASVESGMVGTRVCSTRMLSEVRDVVQSASGVRSVDWLMASGELRNDGGLLVSGFCRTVAHGKSSCSQ